MGDNSPNRRFQFSVRALFAAAFILALLCGGFRGCVLDTSRPIVLTDRSEFPEELISLLEVAQQKQFEVTSLKVLKIPGGMRDDYFWQTDASQELIDATTELWWMKPIPESSSPVQNFWQYWPKVWDRPDGKDRGFLVSPNWQLADWAVLVMHDKTNQRLYYWLINDF